MTASTAAERWTLTDAGHALAGDSGAGWTLTAAGHAVVEAAKIVSLHHERVRITAEYNATAARHPIDCDQLARLARQLAYLRALEGGDVEAAG